MLPKKGTTIRRGYKVLIKKGRVWKPNGTDTKETRGRPYHLGGVTGKKREAISRDRGGQKSTHSGKGSPTTKEEGHRAANPDAQNAKRKDENRDQVPSNGKGGSGRQHYPFVKKRKKPIGDTGRKGQRSNSVLKRRCREKPGKKKTHFEGETKLKNSGERKDKRKGINSNRAASNEGKGCVNPPGLLPPSATNNLQTS